ncbi:MAG: MFS transporter [Candidatus Kariarchaeaceae archaeon]
MADVLKLNTLSYIVIFGASIINLAAGILEPTIAPYLEELGASSQKIGEILAAQWLVVALASIPFALLSTQIGYVRVLYISGVTSIIGGFVLVFMDGIPAVHLFYYIIGLSFAAASGPAAAILAENEGSKRIAAFALFSTTWMIPPALGAGISAWWFRGVDDYAPETISTIFPITLLVLVIGVFPFMVLLFLYRRHDQVTQPEEEVIPIVRQFRILFAPIVALPISLLMVVNFLSGAGAGATLPFLTPYLKSLGADPSEVSILVLILNIAMGVATQFTAPLSKKFGDLQVFAVSTMLSVVCLISLVFSNDLNMAALFYILRGTFANMNAPISQSLVLSYVETKIRATGSAVASNIRWFGWVIFSPISGNLIDAYGYEESFVFTGLIYMVAMILFIWVNSSMPNLEELYSQNDTRLYSSVNKPKINM